MENKNIKRKISIGREGKQWKLYQEFGKFIKKLDQLPDAAEVINNPGRCAPQGLTDMVF
ncbi:hypothetical protein ACRQ5D_34430 [Mucilaginibacter sp. P25]|uniref:hypothetical protein n=1 Tax=Mucilaginibacter sp. P25 TaxID=3423945 RepID=UPI003D7B8DD2